MGLQNHDNGVFRTRPPDTSSLIVQGSVATTCNCSLSLSLDNKSGLQLLLDKYTNIFLEPQGLPPQRSCAHKILLATIPIVVRPHRYPHAQKDEIERQCSDMLAKGIIRPSTSPISAQVLLVRKADCSWRFCVDYRAFNNRTIKDKFHIPVIDKLLEELNGTQYFSKLDLQAGYHQVLMDLDSISMTIFRTHHGHYEFLVMPFGLTITPSTFQALTNNIFERYLCRFFSRFL